MAALLLLPLHAGLGQQIALGSELTVAEAGRFLGRPLVVIADLPIRKIVAFDRQRVMVQQLMPDSTVVTLFVRAGEWSLGRIGSAPSRGDLESGYMRAEEEYRARSSRRMISGVTVWLYGTSDWKDHYELMDRLAPAADSTSSP